ncbi:MAG: hypothetical protein IPJ78_10300 [Gemmatimonadetes bacterium]|nr:hypothetical protein [Gemmatimonadota bacterium]
MSQTVEGVLQAAREPLEGVDRPHQPGVLRRAGGENAQDLLIRRLLVEPVEAVPYGRERANSLRAGPEEQFPQQSLLSSSKPVRVEGSGEGLPFGHREDVDGARRTPFESAPHRGRAALDERLSPCPATVGVVIHPGLDQRTALLSQVEVDVRDAEVHRQPLVDPVEAEDARRLEIGRRVDVLVVVQSPPDHLHPRHALRQGHRGSGSHERLHHEPLPDEERRRIEPSGVTLQLLDDPRADRDRGQEADALHALAHGRDEPDGELVGGLVEAHRVERAFARADGVEGGEEGEDRAGHGVAWNVCGAPRVSSDALDPVLAAFEIKAPSKHLNDRSRTRPARSRIPST